MFVFFGYIAYGRNGIVKGLPCFLAMGVSFSVDSDHCVMSADETYAQRSGIYNASYLFVRFEGSASFPYIVAHHERELAG